MLAFPAAKSKVTVKANRDRWVDCFVRREQREGDSEQLFLDKHKAGVSEHYKHASNDLSKRRVLLDLRARLKALRDRRKQLDAVRISFNL